MPALATLMPWLSEYVVERNRAQVGGHRGGQHLNELLADQAADRAAGQIADQAVAAQRAAQRRAEDLADGHSGRKDVRVERDLGGGDLAVGAFCNVEFVVGMGVVRVVFLRL